MNGPAAIFSAVGASLAAILGAINLYLVGRREQVKWTREALADVLVGFLDASYLSKDRTREALQVARRTEPDGGQDEVGRLLAEAIADEERMRSLQTRLRLLTDSKVVDTAQALREANLEYIRLAGARGAGMSADEDEAFRRQLAVLRDRYVRAAKRALALSSRRSPKDNRRWNSNGGAPT